MTGKGDTIPGAEPRDGDEAAAFARFYDLDLAVEDPGDLPLYLGLAERTGGPVLELAAGTGRIAVPLARLGLDVTAVDLDPAMLARADDRATAARVGDRLTLVEADLLDLETLPLPDAGRYRLAILALNSLFLLAERDAQAAALRVMAGHLAADGLAVVDVWVPAARDLEVYDGRLILDDVRTDDEGTTRTKTWAATHDPTSGAITVTTIHEVGRQGGPAERWVRRDAMRLVGAAELRGFAEAAGLVVETLAGDRDLAPLRPDSERAVLVARRP